MQCAHCCMNAVRHDGRAARYMSREVIEAACALAQEFDEDITLGGGEPTLHPDFIFAFGIAMLHAGSMGTLVITNGTNAALTKKMLHLAHASSGALGFQCEVSVDAYHDDNLVEQEVYDLAERFKLIRNAGHPGNIIRQGRAKSWGDRIACACETLHVSWDGRVHRCSCKRKADYLGNILTDWTTIEHAINESGPTECNGRRTIRP